MMEALTHRENCFITCTIDDKHMPETASVSVREAQLFIKRLRDHATRREPGTRLRYTVAAEYGRTQTKRPHYHWIINGLACRHGYQQLNPRGGFDCMCTTCVMVRKSWPLGFTQVKEFNSDAANYMTKYISDKARGQDPKFLKGREPEFVRQSTKPGLGVAYLNNIAATFTKMEALQNTRGRSYDDVPAAIKMLGGTKRIGTYLQRRLRTMVGRKPEAPQSTLDRVQRKLEPLKHLAKICARRTGTPRLDPRTGKAYRVGVGHVSDIEWTQRMLQTIAEPVYRKNRARSMIPKITRLPKDELK